MYLLLAASRLLRCPLTYRRGEMQACVQGARAFAELTGISNLHNGIGINEARTTHVHNSTCKG